MHCIHTTTKVPYYVHLVNVQLFNLLIIKRAILLDRILMPKQLLSSKTCERSVTIYILKIGTQTNRYVPWSAIAISVVPVLIYKADV